MNIKDDLLHNLLRSYFWLLYIFLLDPVYANEL